MVIPGKRSFPRCVRGCECPPKRNKRKVEVERIHKPLDVPATIFTKHFNDFWLLDTALQCVCTKNVSVVIDSFLFLGPGFIPRELDNRQLEYS